MSNKSKLNLKFDGNEYSIAFYANSTAEAIKETIRNKLAIMPGALLHVIDCDGDEVPIDAGLPPGDYTVTADPGPAGRHFADGLPPLGRAVGSSSGASANRGHTNAEVVEGKFGVLKDLMLRRDISVLWAEAGNAGQLTWATESDVQGHVKNAVTDAVRAAGLENELLVLNEMSVSELRPDVWVVLKHGVPVGVVEVKKPGNGVLNDECVAGQIFDYLEMLHVFHGLESVFGLVTTYEEWRVCWRRGSEETAAATVLPEAGPCNTSLDRSVLATAVREQLHQLRKVPSQEEGSEEEEKEEKEEAGTNIDETFERRVGASGIYRHDSPDLPLVLASAVRKMYASVVQRGSGLLGRPGEVCVMVDEDTWTWKPLPAELQWEKCPRVTTKRLFLVCDFGGGADGRTWLACSSTGAVCVVKFPWEGKEKKESRLPVEEELSLWQQAYGELGAMARVQKLNGSLALLMPFVPHCEKEERKEENVQAAVRAAVVCLANAGLRHVDPRWRHVGLYRNDDASICAVLFDIARAQRVPPSSADAISQMLENLDIT